MRNTTAVIYKSATKNVAKSLANKLSIHLHKSKPLIAINEMKK